MSDTMKITAIVPWYGSKRGMADDIVEELGPHRAYFGLCSGSLAVEMRKPVSSHETVVDLHGDLANLAMVLASDRCVDLYERCSRTLCEESIFDSCKAVIQAAPADPPGCPSDTQDAHVDRAWAYMVTSWVGRNGVAGTKRLNYQMAKRYTPGGGHGGTRWRSAVDSMPFWHDRLRSMTIIRGNVFDIVPKIDDSDGVAIYADPPYLPETRGSCEYEHEFGSEDFPMLGIADDHGRLARELCRFRKARVVVSYYDHPRLADLYPGWTIRKMYRQKNLHVQNRRGVGKIEAPEVLILNGPSFANTPAT